ncbi:MAG: hypothetical protein IKI17_05190 [Oscillospiraceae bacterium]|nr:hypothetical protein [Oscillospiraceae bacterium]
MKRTDRLTIFIAVLLFLGFLAYLGSYAFRALENGVVTAEAISADFDLSGTASGILIREETVLTSSAPYVDVTAANGARVAAGSVVATAVSGPEGLERANRIHALETEIERVSAALAGLSSVSSVTSRETALTAAARNVAAVAARHDMLNLDSAATQLSGLLLGVDSSQISYARLDELQGELRTLRARVADDDMSIRAEFPSTFSSLVDGYEHLRMEDVDGVSPSRLEELIEQGRETVPEAFGKLVSGYRWYFAAAMRSVDAANLSPGRSAKLNFGRHYSADISARVLSISPSENGSVTVLFRCDTAMAETLALRSATASVIFGSYSGIRIPAQAVQVDEETQSTYVWCVTAMRLERKPIRILYAANEYVIVERGSAADALREGNTVVVRGKDLEEGKLIDA